MTVVGENETRLTINHLQMFVGYFFRISAFTSKGEGNISESILALTDEDGKDCLSTVIISILLDCLELVLFSVT